MEYGLVFPYFLCVSNLEGDCKILEVYSLLNQEVLKADVAIRPAGFYRKASGVLLLSCHCAELYGRIRGTRG